MDEWNGTWIEGWIDERINEWMNEWVAEWILEIRMDILCIQTRIAYNVFNMDRKLGFIAKLPLIIGGFFELG